MTIYLDVKIPWFTEDERDTIVANLESPRRTWVHAYHNAVGNGNHDIADLCLTIVLDFDRMIAKVEAMSDA